MHVSFAVANLSTVSRVTPPTVMRRGRLRGDGVSEYVVEGGGGGGRGGGVAYVATEM